MEPSTLVPAALSKVIEYVDFVNNWLDVEIELMLPVVVLVTLIAKFAARPNWKKRGTEDRVLLLIAFGVGAFVQVLFGEPTNPLGAVRSALFLGSISVVFHYGVRDYLLQFIHELVPWAFAALTGGIKTVVQTKLKLLTGKNLESLTEDEEGGENE